MAEIDYLEDFGGSSSDDTRIDFGRWANLSGALVSLVLIGGLSVWGYKLLIRDVAGVPVVQAMEGAFRVAPEDPGGMRARHQGLAVNEIAAVGEASGPVDEVRLAPPPIGLTDQDLAAAEMERANAAQRSNADPADRDATAPSVVAEEVATAADLSDVPDDALATDRAIAEALAMPQDDPAAAAEQGAQVISAVSPRPVPRPARLSTSAAGDQTATSGTAGIQANATDVDVTELDPGTRLVQLGAFATAEIAQAEWDQIARRFPDYFDGKRRVVQKAQSGGKTFYRLRAEGFRDLADTRRFCTALVAGQADCIPVELR